MLPIICALAEWCSRLCETVFIANDADRADMSFRPPAHLRICNAPHEDAARLHELATLRVTVKERFRNRYPPMTATP